MARWEAHELDNVQLDRVAGMVMKILLRVVPGPAYQIAQSGGKWVQSKKYLGLEFASSNTLSDIKWSKILRQSVSDCINICFSVWWCTGGVGVITNLLACSHINHSSSLLTGNWQYSPAKSSMRDSVTTSLPLCCCYFTCLMSDMYLLFKSSFTTNFVYLYTINIYYQ